MKIKVFLPQKFLENSEMNLLIIPGLRVNPRIMMVDSGENADIIIYGYSGGEEEIAVEEKWKHKSIMLDFQDLQNNIIKGDWFLYFKRSMISFYDNKEKYIINYDTEYPVFHLGYSVKEVNFKTGFDLPEVSEKEYDVCCLFDLDRVFVGGSTRNKVVNFIKNLELKGLKINVGLKNWYHLRRDLNEDYFNIMKKSKIIVTCNPDIWEGDFRLFEALTCKSLVFCDDMKLKMGLDNHIIWYNPHNLKSLENKIFYYLNNNIKRQSIIDSTYEYVKTYYTPSGRIDYILNIVENYL